MYNNPYWAPQAPMMSAFPYLTPVVQQPQPIMPQPTNNPPPSNPAPAPSTPTALPSTWNWKAVANYQSMLMESVPFDGSPVLFMIQNEPVFYVVRMEEGRKMINGFTFTPLDNPEEPEVVPETPEEQLENRLVGLERNMSSIMTQLERLVGGANHESNNEPARAENNVPKRKAVTTVVNPD